MPRDISIKRIRASWRTKKRPLLLVPPAMARAQGGVPNAHPLIKNGNAGANPEYKAEELGQRGPEMWREGVEAESRIFDSVTTGLLKP